MIRRILRWFKPYRDLERWLAWSNEAREFYYTQVLRLQQELMDAQSLAERREKNLREGCRNEVAETKKLVDAVVSRCARMKFVPTSRNNRQVFGLNLTFEPEVIGAHVCSRQELHVIAESVGRQVEAEIASARFLASTTEWEREEREGRKRY
jgi:hypothetical protein